MGRDDLCITIPSFFRCPISLDVMKSPVSLSTGVTYDRASIQRWLDCGNNTCPATMQILPNKEFVPNHTVQRLIQIWSDSVKTRPAITDSTPNSVTNSEAKSLAQQLKSIFTATPPYPLTIISHISSKLILFAKFSEENSTFLSMDSELLRLILSKFTLFSNNVQLTEKLLQLLYLMLKSFNGENEFIVPKGDELVKSLTVNLMDGTLEARITAMKVLKSLADIRAELKALMGESYALYAGLLSLITYSEVGDQDLESCLQCLISIAMPKRNRVKLVRAGAVPVLAKALQEGEVSHILTEKILKLIELMSTFKEGRIEICGDEICVLAVLKKMLKVSNVATEHAVTILWSLCFLFSDKRAQEAVAKSNGMAKILLLLQSNVSPAVRQMCTDLLKVFRVGSKSSSFLSSYDTKTTHIMPF